MTFIQTLFLFIILVAQQGSIHSMYCPSEQNSKISHKKNKLGTNKKVNTSNKKFQQLVVTKKFEKPIDVFTTKKEKNKTLKIEPVNHLQDRLIQRILAELPQQEPGVLFNNNTVIPTMYSVHNSDFLEWTEQ